MRREWQKSGLPAACFPFRAVQRQLSSIRTVPSAPESHRFSSDASEVAGYTAGRESAPPQPAKAGKRIHPTLKIDVRNAVELMHNQRFLENPIRNTKKGQEEGGGCAATDALHYVFFELFFA